MNCELYSRIHSFTKDECIYYIQQHPIQIGGMDLQMGTTSVVEIDETYFSNRKYNRGRVNRGQWGFGGIKRKSVDVSSYQLKNLLSWF